MYPNRRRGVPEVGVMLLAYQLFGVMGLNHIPPVTLAIVGLQSAIYLRLIHLPWYKASQVCISVLNVWYRQEYRRLLYGALEHSDDWHLYYNMLSFVVKGQALEKRFGSIKFFYLTSVFTVLTSMTLVALSLLAADFNQSIINQCAVGFSGVIFALKVLTSYYNPNYSSQIMGIPIIIPARYAVWVELILIQILVPNASFLGHFAGILVGLAYVKGPLGPILDSIYSVAFVFDDPSRATRSRFIPRAEPSGYRHDQNHQRFSRYVPADMSEAEQLRRATEESLRENRNGPFRDTRAYAPVFDLYPDIEETRARRHARHQ